MAWLWSQRCPWLPRNGACRKQVAADATVVRRMIAAVIILWNGISNKTSHSQRCFVTLANKRM